MNNLVFGRYIAGRSLLHRADPRIKMTALAALTVSVLLAGNFRALAAGFAVLVLAARLSKLSLLSVGRSIRPLWPLLAVTFALGVVGGPGALPRAIVVAGRLALALSFSAVLTATTAPSDLAGAIGSLLSPLRRVRVPSDELALMVSIAVRFVPVVAREAEEIVSAQEARGHDIRVRGHPVRTFNNFRPILIPLVAATFRRADELALAMEARGYRPGKYVRANQALRLGRAEMWAIALGLGGVLLFSWLGG